MIGLSDFIPYRATATRKLLEVTEENIVDVVQYFNGSISYQTDPPKFYLSGGNQIVPGDIVSLEGIVFIPKNWEKM